MSNLFNSISKEYPNAKLETQSFQLGIVVYYIYIKIRSLMIFKRKEKRTSLRLFKLKE